MRIPEFKNKLYQLKKLDPACKVFGAKKHRYELNPCLTEEEIQNFEKHFSVILPAEYRDFLKLLGNGGAGPGYGIFTLQEASKDADPSYLTKPFPHTVKWNSFPSLATSYDSAVVAQFKNEQEYFSDKHTRGSIKISHESSAIYTMLVVTGPEAGQIWIDDRANDNGIFPAKLADKQRIYFSEWYNDWLEKSLKELGKAIRE